MEISMNKKLTISVLCLLNLLFVPIMGGCGLFDTYSYPTIATTMRDFFGEGIREWSGVFIFVILVSSAGINICAFFKSDKPFHFAAAHGILVMGLTLGRYIHQQSAYWTSYWIGFINTMEDIFDLSHTRIQIGTWIAIALFTSGFCVTKEKKATE